MPKLWNETVAEHREAVREAALDAAGTLVAARGLASVTMSAIAAKAGIGRATLYKYFPEVEAVLVAWHKRQIGMHLGHLVAVRDAAGSPGERLAAVLAAYATMSWRHGDGDLAALLHRGAHVARAEKQLVRFIRDLVAEGAVAGEIRTDMTPEELASFCLHALGAAADLTSKAAVLRLVRLTVAALARPGPAGRR